MGWLPSWKGNARSADEHSRTTEGQNALNYQSFPTGNARDQSESKAGEGGHRGFSTSITHMFVDPEHERVDCCALACCGVFQSDRDRFLITGIMPPSFCKRVWVHFCMPLWIFGMAVFCAVRIEDVVIRQFFSTLLIFLLVAYFVGQCMKGMSKRREIREELLWSRYEMTRTGEFRYRVEEDFPADSMSGRRPAYLMGQTTSDIRNAHSLFGCYARDYDPSHKTDQYSFCTRTFQCFSEMWCGLLCQCHLQLCGVCGIAQEGREVEKLVLQKYRRVDYITMQPMLEYYIPIYEARNNDNDELTFNVWESWNRLSTFSRWVLVTISIVSAVLFFWSVMGYQREFGLKNFGVFSATLLQAYGIMKLVHWKHVKDISTDALIKYFVSGFCLSTSLAVFFEIVVGLIMKLVMSIIMVSSGIDVVSAPGYSLDGYMLSPGFANVVAMQGVDDTPTYRDFVRAYGNDHPVVYTIYLFVNAFILAATVEELCKYFGFRMIEHPDFYSSHDLADAATAESEQSADDPHGPRDTFPAQDRSAESRGAAVTVAMVSTALGFACCENLVYIFIYGSSNFSVEIVILLARSLFPVHPIAAALQSIGVCERDIEKKRSTGLGRIVFPGILFHGVYDFLLMWFDFNNSRKSNGDGDDDETIAIDDEGSDGLSFPLSFLVLIAALLYFFWASKLQRGRFQSMDRNPVPTAPSTPF